MRSLVSLMSPFDVLLRKETSSSVNGTFLYSIIGRADNHEQKLEPRDRGDREICESLETIRLPFKEYVVFRKRVNPEPSKVLKRWTLPPEKAKVSFIGVLSFACFKILTLLSFQQPILHVHKYEMLDDGTWSLTCIGTASTLNQVSILCATPSNNFFRYTTKLIQRE